MSLRPALSVPARSLLSTLPAHRSPRPQHVLYEDRGIIVINKPSGLVCQSDKTYEQRHGRRCAFDELLEDLRDELNLDEIPKQVHRLDKYTSGAYILAKSDVHARSLSLQFRDHSLKKTYLALVRGGRKSFPDAARGTIDSPLSVANEKTIVDERQGRPALTDWELLGSSEVVPLSLLRLTLHSGRKHQLRVHLAETMQTPILGDTFYSSKPPLQSILDIIPKGVTVVSQNTRPATHDWGPETSTRRLFLHSAHMDVTRYRATGPSKRLTLGVSAPVPWYFWKLCKAARIGRCIPPQYIHGGLSVDGAPVALDEEIAGLEGKWLGS